MSATASVPNPLAGQTGLGAPKTAAGQPAGALGVFDVIFASVFAAAGGAGGPTQNAPQGLFAAGTPLASQLAGATVSPLLGADESLTEALPEAQGEEADADQTSPALNGPDAAMVALLTAMPAQTLAAAETLPAATETASEAGGSGGAAAAPAPAEPFAPAADAPFNMADAAAVARTGSEPKPSEQPLAAPTPQPAQPAAPAPILNEAAPVTAEQPAEVLNTADEPAPLTPSADLQAEPASARAVAPKSPAGEPVATSIPAAPAEISAKAQAPKAEPAPAPAPETVAASTQIIETLAAEAPAPAAAQAPAAAPPAPKGKDKAPATARVEATPEGAPQSAAPQAKANGAQAAASTDSKSSERAPLEAAASGVAEAARDESGDDTPTPAPLSAQVAPRASEAELHTPPAPVRGSPETVANLAAQVIKKLEGRSTRFDLQLDPLGLGRVDVRLEIGAHGQVTAAMSFDNPQAAAELKARASELQRVLEQAGFDLSGGLSFDVAGDPNSSGRQAQNQAQDGQAGASFRGRAFEAALNNADGAAAAAVNSALYLRRAPTTGVDVRI